MTPIVVRCRILFISEDILVSLNQLGTMAGLDEPLAALQDPLRRQLLLALFEQSSQDESIAIGEAIDAEDGLETQHERQLYHNHLPKLEAFDFIEYDYDEKEIAPGPEFERVEPVLEALDDHAEDLLNT